MEDFTNFKKADLEILVNSGAKEIFTFDQLHAIPEGWEMIGDYEENYETIARVLKGESGQIYIYYI